MRTLDWNASKTVALRTAMGTWVHALRVPAGAGMLPGYVIWNGRLWRQSEHQPPLGHHAAYTEEFAWTAPEGL